MTEQETPNSNPPEQRSVLGVDPPEPTPPTPEPEAPVTPTPEPELEKVSLDPEEYQTLRDQAANYLTLTSDDQLQALIYGYLRDKAAGIVNSQPNDMPQVNNEPSEHGRNPIEQRMARMEQFMQQGAQHIQQQNNIIQRQQEEIGNLKADLFGRDNPSFRQHKSEIAKVREKYPSLSLEDALTLVEAKAGRAGNKTVDGSRPAMPTTEGGSAGSMPNTTSSPGGIEGDRMAELAKRINDPKATPSMDDALDAIGREMGLNS